MGLQSKQTSKSILYSFSYMLRRKLKKTYTYISRYIHLDGDFEGRKNAFSFFFKKVASKCQNMSDTDLRKTNRVGNLSNDKAFFSLSSSIAQISWIEWKRLYLF